MCNACCVDNIHVLIGRFEKEKIKDLTESEEQEAITINWGQSGVNKIPSEAEITRIMKIIQKKAATTNVISLDNIREEMYEWIKDNITNACIKIVLDGRDSHDALCILIGIDKATVMAYHEKI